MKFKKAQKGFSLLEVILAISIIGAFFGMAYTQVKQTDSAQAQVAQQWDAIIQSSPSSSRVIIEHLRNTCKEVIPNQNKVSLAKYQECVDAEVLRLAAQAEVSQMNNNDFDQLRTSLAGSFDRR